MARNGQAKKEKDTIIKYATRNVRGIVHKEEELNSVLNEKQNKIAKITGYKYVELYLHSP